MGCDVLRVVSDAPVISGKGGASSSDVRVQCYLRRAQSPASVVLIERIEASLFAFDALHEQRADVAVVGEERAALRRRQ
jgi:hypothetical protein